MFITYRIITADEYDWAARHTPHLCPLALAGDRRSGMQLLHDAAADSLVSMERLAGSPDGRAKLNTLAGAVEFWAGEVERRGAKTGPGRDRAPPAGESATVAAAVARQADLSRLETAI